jgi:proteasome assembly chaperone (PAC2) family protein
MAMLRWHERPDLDRPVLVAGFEGWNDAGNAASEAVSFLRRRWQAEAVASFDSEELFDYTATRPRVRIEEGDTRHLEWPTVELARARVPVSGGAGAYDALLLSGPEPQLRWRSFTAAVSGAARELGIRTAVLLGALLADVPHTRPAKVTGGSATAELARLAGVEPSYYEGPTGIVGVLTNALSEAGIPTVSLWASVPHYVSQSPSPKATLALLERTARVLGAQVDLTDLRVAATAYERQIDELVNADEDAAAYVRRLEDQEEQASRAEADLPSPRLGLASGERLAAEAERYLREQRRD